MNKIQALTHGLVWTGLCLLAGCGRPLAEAAPAPTAPTSTQAPAEEAEAEPTTLADAEALLERARADLERVALNEPGAPAAGAVAPSAAPTPAPSRDEASREDKAASAEQAAPPPPAKEANACETACKAFSSLARASDAVCRLDSDGGKRCERARQIREDASHRVASCGCAR
jgi:hypothetical protein